jgi:phosphomannomutase/phosphoglucomutase
MFKKKNSEAGPAKDGRKPIPGTGPKDAAKRNALGVTAGGDALQKAALLGLALIILPALLCLAFLALVNAPGRQDALLEQVADTYAEQQARLIGKAVLELRARVNSAARSSLVMEALDGANDSAGEGALAAAEAALREFFPDVLSLRLLPLTELGTAALSDGPEGLRNHIEIDLVRRASNGQQAQPEAYEYDGQLLASLAQVASHPRIPDRRAVVLVTVGEDLLADLLSWPGEMPGRFSLRQRIYGNGADRDVDILSRGQGSAASPGEAVVADTPWLIEFTPSVRLAERVTGGARPAYGVFLLVVAFAIAGMALLLLRVRAALAGEVARIVDSAEQRTPLVLSIPQLLPLAVGLRRAAGRRKGGEPSTQPAEAGHAAKKGTALTGVNGPAPEELPRHIFRAYDIRGVADRDLDDETVYRIGSAIATIAGEMGEQTLALGYDGRASSGRLRGLVEKALLRAGRDVVDIGLVPTPLLYFATHRSEAGSGIMITGSHSPAHYNGMKIVLKGQTLAEGAIDRVRDLAQSGQFSAGRGRLIQRSMVSTYIDEVVSDIAIAVPLKVVVDAGNGATGHIAPALLEELGCEVIPLNCEVDGSFPNRSPDTGDEAALAGLVEAVKAEQADFGVAYDGDGDRLAVVTGSGRILRTDVLMMLFARDVVARHPGADVVYDVKCSRDLAQLITSLGGRPVLWKTGHALMKQKMAETGALLGGEFSGHIFFGERWYGFDDGMYATGRLAEILSSQELSLDDFIADLPAAVSTPEILIEVPDDEKFELIDRFCREASFPNGKSNDLDGLRVDFPEGWGLLRASNTGPALTARFEGRDEATLKEIQNRFREELGRVAPDLDIPF